MEMRMICCYMFLKCAQNVITLDRTYSECLAWQFYYSYEEMKRLSLSEYLDHIDQIYSRHSAAFLEKLLVAPLFTKFPAVYGTGRFISVYKNPQLDLILSHIKTVHKLTPYHFNFNITFRPRWNWPLLLSLSKRMIWALPLCNHLRWRDDNIKAKD
jgi:hypothetical protein